MADYSKEDLVRMIKRFGAYLTFKISNLFSISLDNLVRISTFLSSELNNDSRSTGILAGLAIAILLTWRLFRSPTRHQRRQPKQHAPVPSSSGISTHSNADLTSSGVCSSSEESRSQNVIDEFFQPVKPTLGQIVRQKLSEGRKVTCRLLGIVLEETIPEELQKQVTVRSSVLEVLLEITKFCDLYLMESVLDDESEAFKISGLLPLHARIGNYKAHPGLVSQRALRCLSQRTGFLESASKTVGFAYEIAYLHPRGWFSVFGGKAALLIKNPHCARKKIWKANLFVVGDFPRVKITLRRTWAKMPLWHKTKLLYSLVFQAFFLPSPEDLNKMLKEMDDVDMLTLVIQEMSKEFPTLMETLVHERDQYMSSALLRVASESGSVVAVVGKGHLQGIKKHWKQPVEVQDLMHVDLPSQNPAISSVKILTTLGVTVAGLVIISGLYVSTKR
ncbi:TraB family protein [Actinidia rufa]|uniref:TraB family protein n=1 Tax=Actinidia rufa TaxID=165716 RepID=A0A7J0H6M6_9ERIC|nr:TraB family protein [Actinidia rufa]